MKVVVNKYVIANNKYYLQKILKKIKETKFCRLINGKEKKTAAAGIPNSERR